MEVWNFKKQIIMTKLVLCYGIISTINVSTHNYSPIWNRAWGEVAMATEKACKYDPAHDFHNEQNWSMAARSHTHVF